MKHKIRKSIEADRPAPYVDETKYFVYKYGCDSHLIYPESHRKALNRLLVKMQAKGQFPQKVFRGERDQSREYPEMYDNNIPQSYVNQDFASPSAPGYGRVWCEDQYAVLRTDLEKVEAEIEAEKKARKESQNAERQAKFDEARRTGKPVLLFQTWDYCNDPSEECDIDNVYVYVMPNGAEKEERHHSY